MKNFSNSYQKFVFGLEQINQAAAECPIEFIKDIEKTYHEEISNTVDYILSKKDKCKVVMLSGPSGSGKTTTAYKIREELIRRGSGAVIISLDDFYRDRTFAPLQEDGTPDYECVEALDVKEIKRCIASLMTNRKCDIPKFDFMTQKPSDDKVHVELQENEFAIIEGIHGLNPIFTNDLPDENIIRVYISVKQGITDYNGLVIPNRSIRLVRRIVRDYSKRKSDAQTTLSMWDNVCKGQALYIYPFKRMSDITINSIHMYELCVLRNVAIQHLQQIQENNPCFKEALKLISSLERFYPINIEYVPKNSLLREFLGGGIY